MLQFYRIVPKTKRARLWQTCPSFCYLLYVSLIILYHGCPHATVTENVFDD